MGRRVKKSVLDKGTSQTTVTLFVYDGWNLIQELDGNDPDIVKKSYVWGLDLSQSLQGAGGVGGLLAMTENGNTYLYCHDANGNVGIMVNATDGTVATEYEYAPFGAIVHQSDGAVADANPFRFSTKYYDTETGLYYYGYRYYSVEMGRWLSRDPMGEEGGVNLYVMAGNSIINTYDILGLHPFEIFPDRDLSGVPVDDLIALAALDGANMASFFAGFRATHLFLNNYLNKGGDMVMPDWVIEDIEAHPRFKERRNAYLSTLITTSSGKINHQDSDFIRSVKFMPEDGDLWSSFNDLYFKLGLRGCASRDSSGCYIFYGKLKTDYWDWWGFALYDPSGVYTGRRRPFAAMARYSKLSKIVPDEILNIQEKSFVQLQNRGLVKSFNINGLLIQNVKIKVCGRTANIEWAAQTSIW
jgi:RHS repeat-associated protein